MNRAIQMARRNGGIYILLLIGFLSGCTNHGELKQERAEPLILRTEVARIPAEGHVTELKGRATVLKKFHHKNGYKDVTLGETLNDGDILVLYEKSILVLNFSNSQKIVMQSYDKARWFTIRFDKGGN